MFTYFSHVVHATQATVELICKSLSNKARNTGNEIYPDGYEKVFMHLDCIRKHTQDGQFCEGRHHPFAKPGHKGQSLHKPGKKPWDVDIFSTSDEVEGVFVTSGVLVSDRHIIASAKRIQGYNGHSES